MDEIKELKPYSKAWWVYMYHLAHLECERATATMRASKGMTGVEHGSRYLYLKRWIKDRIDSIE